MYATVAWYSLASASPLDSQDILQIWFPCFNLKSTQGSSEVTTWALDTEIVVGVEGLYSENSQQTSSREQAKDDRPSPEVVEVH